VLHQSTQQQEPIVNRTTVMVRTPVAVATLALALTTTLFGYSTLTRQGDATDLTPAERQAAIKIHEAQASRAAMFPDCPSGPVNPPKPC
jgi:hypothetical protein